jgi:hypothetical protein
MHKSKARKNKQDEDDDDDDFELIEFKERFFDLEKEMKIRFENN